MNRDAEICHCLIHNENLLNTGLKTCLFYWIATKESSCEFKDLCHTVSENGDVAYCTEERWFDHGRNLKGFYGTASKIELLLNITWKT